MVSYAEQGGYTLHPLVRQYAAEKLGDDPAVYLRHALFYGRHLQQQEARFSSEASIESLAIVRQASHASGAIESVREISDEGQRALESVREMAIRSSC